MEAKELRQIIHEEIQSWGITVKHNVQAVTFNVEATYEYTLRPMKNESTRVREEGVDYLNYLGADGWVLCGMIGDNLVFHRLLTTKHTEKV